MCKEEDATMATTSNKQQMMDALKRAQADIACLLDWFECELDKYGDDDKVSWATVGSLGYVREHLLDTLAFFSGFEQAEIQRNLDELHM